MAPQLFVGQADGTLATVVLFWLVFYVWIGSELFVGWKLRAPAGANTHDAASRFVLIGSIYVGIGVGFALAFAAQSAAFTQWRRPFLALGLALMLTGMALRWYSIRVLGRSFTTTVMTRPDQTVVESGPYRWIRHPSYTGGLLTVLGVLICLTNPVSFLGLIPPLAGYAYRIRVEENALASSLGEPYQAYMRRTKRLIPFLV
ncbi:MAG TPA: isoprenylcysteine carboxylmethyltransferase family protein [Candidatus Dormibacteraeota bacterium]|nr:isoprenylcysteine carboxylmethyltransferase family protein [Candidatus Dormibacteraeota bacterium]